MTLHVTNGDIVAERLRAIGVDGCVLPWREILHEGVWADYASVDAQGRHQFNLNRALYVESKGWGRANDVVEDMDNRDAMLLDPHWKEVVIWMEPDLFDQLIMAQVLTILYRTGRFSLIDVRLVQASKHLNYHMDSELVHASRTPHTLTSETIAPYLKFWKDVAGGKCTAERTDVPIPLQVAQRQWNDLQPGDDGLSCFDKRVINLVQRSGSVSIGILFQQINAEEGNSAFWGDVPFVSRIQDLSQKVPMLALHDNVVEYVG